MDCTPACAVTVAANPAASNLGLGFAPADAGFALLGAIRLPFRLAPAQPECSDAENLVRGELPLLVQFRAGAVEETKSADLILESDDPGAPRIAVPLQATSRAAPIAVATSCTSAPTDSQRSAISLMKVTFMARNALAAYLASSADSRLTKTTGALRSASGL